MFIIDIYNENILYLNITRKICISGLSSDLYISFKPKYLFKDIIVKILPKLNTCIILVNKKYYIYHTGGDKYIINNNININTIKDSYNGFIYTNTGIYYKENKIFTYTNYIKSYYDIVMFDNSAIIVYDPEIISPDFKIIEDYNINNYKVEYNIIELYNSPIKLIIFNNVIDIYKTNIFLKDIIIKYRFHGITIDNNKYNVEKFNSRFIDVINNNKTYKNLQYINVFYRNSKYYNNKFKKLNIPKDYIIPDLLNNNNRIKSARSIL